MSQSNQPQPLVPGLSGAAPVRLTTALRPSALPALPSKTNGPASFIGVIGPSGPRTSAAVGVVASNELDGPTSCVASRCCGLVGLLGALGEHEFWSDPPGLAALMPRCSSELLETFRRDSRLPEVLLLVAS